MFSIAAARNTFFLVKGFIRNDLHFVVLTHALSLSLCHSLDGISSLRQFRFINAASRMYDKRMFIDIRLKIVLVTATLNIS